MSKYDKQALVDLYDQKTFLSQPDIRTDNAKGVSHESLFADLWEHMKRASSKRVTGVIRANSDENFYQFVCAELGKIGNFGCFLIGNGTAIEITWNKDLV